MQFIKESVGPIYSIPSYEEAVEMCNKPDSAFYESKLEVDGFTVSIFNYRLAQFSDFNLPLENKPEVKAFEMRGLTFVFNKDGSLYKRFVLLEKFFNLNQVPNSMYSVVKDYKIRYINNKEDGSIASFIQLPNGKIVGRSKMGFDNDQANGINKIYKTNKDVNSFVDWALNNDIVPIFEYVAPHNRIVLRYSQEELILLRLRDNKTGKHIDIKDHLDKIGSIKIAPFEDEIKDLDHLIELIATQVDKEGSIVTCEDEYGRDFFFKLKTPWYMALHGLLTDDIYKENIIISYILDDKIDDILGQIPEDEKEAHQRINKIIEVVKRAISDKTQDLNISYKLFVDMEKNRKEYALKYRGKEPNFGYVMAMAKGIDPYDLSKNWISDNTKRLMMAREWLKKREPSLFFKDPDEEVQDQ
jgi:T4 RnlA family RNA ligase